MKISGKLRSLLLVASLLPLLLSSGLFLLLLNSLGDHFSSDAKEFLVEQSYEHLHAMILDSELLVRKNFQLIDWVVDGQGHEIRHGAGDEETLKNLLKPQPDKSINISNSYDFSHNETNLDSLGEVFQALQKKAPDMLMRQYVALSSGVGYFLSSTRATMTPVDLSDQKWLTGILQKRGITRALVEDSQGSSLKLVVGTSLQDSTGSTWGMTAVEVPLANLFSPLRMPETWRTGARVMLASQDRNAENLSIVAEAVNGGDWQFSSMSDDFKTVFLEASAAIVASMEGGRSGVTMVSHQDGVRHWAYGPPLWDEFFPLMMVEHDQIISLALESEQHVLSNARLGIAFVMAGLLVLVGLSAVAAGYFSRLVTEPVRELSGAFNRLAKGDFATRVTIGTGDELEALGHNFNDLGGKLEDRSRMANTLALARDVQQHLLPIQPPIIPGLDLFSCGIPCDEVGGDYYDFISQEDKSKAQIGIAVGDVSGHGVPAALLMASARGVLRSHAWCRGVDLTFLFQLLNTHLVKDSAHDRFMTLFYGILDLEEGSLRWNSAGHGPILLYQSQSHKIRELVTTGPPLGIDETLSYEPQTFLNLHAGDILLAATDGLWEVRNQAGEIWGIETIKNKLLQVTTRSAAEIGKFLLAEQTAFRNGRKQEDDISLVIAKLAASGLSHNQVRSL